MADKCKRVQLTNFIGTEAAAGQAVPADITLKSLAEHMGRITEGLIKTARAFKNFDITAMEVRQRQRAVWLRLFVMYQPSIAWQKAGRPFTTGSGSRRNQNAKKAWLREMKLAVKENPNTVKFYRWLIFKYGSDPKRLERMMTITAVFDSLSDAILSQPPVDTGKLAASIGVDRSQADKDFTVWNRGYYLGEGFGADIRYPVGGVIGKVESYDPETKVADIRVDGKVTFP